MRRMLLLGLLGLAAPAFAHEKGERLAGLDEAAKVKVQQTFEKFRPQIQPLRQDLKQTRLALREQLDSASPDEGKVAALTTQLQSDRRQMMSIAQKRADELKGELTPSQYARLMMARHHRR